VNIQLPLYTASGKYRQIKNLNPQIKTRIMRVLFLVRKEREERKKTIVIYFFFFRVFCVLCGQYSSYLRSSVDLLNAH
jgi:hypothetical protein